MLYLSRQKKRLFLNGFVAIFSWRLNTFGITKIDKKSVRIIMFDFISWIRFIRLTLNRINLSLRGYFFKFYLIGLGFRVRLMRKRRRFFRVNLLQGHYLYLLVNNLILFKTFSRKTIFCFSIYPAVLGDFIASFMLYKKVNIYRKIGILNPYILMRIKKGKIREGQSKKDYLYYDEDSYLF